MRLQRWRSTSRLRQIDRRVVLMASTGSHAADAKAWARYRNFPWSPTSPLFFFPTIFSNVFLFSVWYFKDVSFVCITCLNLILCSYVMSVSTSFCRLIHKRFMTDAQFFVPSKNSQDLLLTDILKVLNSASCFYSFHIRQKESNRIWRFEVNKVLNAFLVKIAFYKNNNLCC